MSEQRILVVGDVHGEFGKLNALINVKKPDLILQCGDFGYWPKWSLRHVTPIDKVKTKGAKLLFCDGNHDDHWSLRDRESDELAPNVFYMPRGSTYELDDGRNILFMGGADSIDKHLRMLGRDWFPEEVIQHGDMENLPDKKIDIFITHTCPEELVHDLVKIYPLKTFEPSNVALSQLRKMYKPDLWFFGHWHRFMQGILFGTQWYALDYPSHGTNWLKWLPDPIKEKQ